MEQISYSRRVPALSELIETLKSRYTQYRLYRTTLNELNALSQRELNDLGLNATSLRDIASEAAYGR